MTDNLWLLFFVAVLIVSFLIILAVVLGFLFKIKELKEIQGLLEQKNKHYSNTIDNFKKDILALNEQSIQDKSSLKICEKHKKDLDAKEAIVFELEQKFAKLQYENESSQNSFRLLEEERDSLEKEIRRIKKRNEQLVANNKNL